MSNKIQVPREHYFNTGYNHKSRWLTYFYQMQLLKKYDIATALEIGPGHSWMKKIVADLGVTVKTVDIDASLNPDYVAEISKLPLPDNSFDCVCAFEVLEHLPFTSFAENLMEMSRVSKKYVIISLPDHRHMLFHLRFKVPYIKYKEFFQMIPTGKEHVFDGQHYWEIGKKGYSPKVVKDEIKKAGLKLVESIVEPDATMNHFFVAEKVL